MTRFARDAGEYGGPFTEIMVIAVAAALGALLRLGNSLNLTGARAWGSGAGGLGLVEALTIRSRLEGLQLFGVTTGAGLYALLAASAVLIVAVFLDADV